jgi:hypothetical protein
MHKQEISHYNTSFLIVLLIYIIIFHNITGIKTNKSF